MDPSCPEEKWIGPKERVNNSQHPHVRDSAGTPRVDPDQVTFGDVGDKLEQFAHAGPIRRKLQN